MAPFGSYVKAACERVSKLDLEMICPGHGPVIDTDIKKQIEIYCSLADKVTPKNDMGHVTIVFASAYGYTRAMAEYLKAYLEKAGKNVSYYEINALNYENQKSAILNDIRTSGLVLLGSPTLVGDAICLFYDLLACLTWTTGQGKKASAFGDYGWSGEAVKNLSDRLAELRFSVIPGFRYSFKLDEPGKEALGKYAESLLEAIK
jgi:flavorubredoxin